jgi:hypothetical protein
MVNIILRTCDGADHEVSGEVASLSKTIKSLLEDLEGVPASLLISLSELFSKAICLYQARNASLMIFKCDSAAREGEQRSLIVPLPNVCHHTLRKVLEYCEHHMNVVASEDAQCPSEPSRQLRCWESAFMAVSIASICAEICHPVIVHACMHSHDFMT